MIHKIAHDVSIELSVDETFNDISHKQLLARGIFFTDSVVEDFVDGTLVSTVKAFVLGRRRRKHRDSFYGAFIKFLVISIRKKLDIFFYICAIFLLY